MEAKVIKLNPGSTITEGQKQHMIKLLKSHVFDLERSTFMSEIDNFSYDEAGQIIEFLQVEVKVRKDEEAYESAKKEFQEFLTANYDLIEFQDLVNLEQIYLNPATTTKQFKEKLKEIKKELNF